MYCDSKNAALMSVMDSTESTGNSFDILGQKDQFLYSGLSNRFTCSLTDTSTHVNVSVTTGRHASPVLASVSGGVR